MAFGTLIKRSNDARPKVVIIGGGAGGLELAVGLSRRLRRQGAGEITLVDRKMTHVWKPLFHEVASGTRGHSGDEINYLSLAEMHGFRFRTGNLLSIDRAARRVTISGRVSEAGWSIPERTLPYDILVLALGSEPRTFGIPGVAENCFFLDTLEQAHRFRNAFFEHCLRIDTMDDPADKMLNVSIIGGGATGVELAAELTNAIAHMTQYGFDAFDPADNVAIRLIEASPRLLPVLAEPVSRMAQDRLTALGVEVRTACKVERIDAEGTVQLAGGTALPSHMTVWVAGIGAPSILRSFGCIPLTASGLVEVRDTLQIVGDDRVFAIGDCAASIDPASGRPLPPKAQVASQQAGDLARELARFITSGAALRPFRYRDRGSLVNIGAHSTIGQLMGNLLGTKTIDGWLARRAYKYLYRRHQLAVHGPLRASLLILSEALRDWVHPRLKLH